MKYAFIIFRNLFRKKIRTTLTVLSIAVSLFLYGLLVTINASFQGGIDVAGADRLVTRNKTSLIMFLPYKYKQQMLQVDGVEDVTFAVWFGGVYKDPKNFFPQFAVEGDSYLRIYPEIALPQRQIDAFLADREGAIIGRKTAERFGIKVGDRVPLQGTIFAGQWEFNIRGIFDGKRPQDDTTFMLLRYERLEEQVEFVKGNVGWYIVKVKDPNRSEGIAKAVDRLFANSAFETLTEPEKVFMTGFVKQMGNIRLLIISIGAVVLFTLLLVTGNTMAIAVRERTGELAVMKTVGFTDEAILMLVLAESMIIAIMGGVIGILLAKLFTLGGDPTRGFLPIFYFSPWHMAVGLILAGAVGLAAGLTPAVLAMRLRIVDALRRV